VTEKHTLPTLALAFTLLAASSATALDRTGPQIAQAGPEDGEVGEKERPAAREKAPQRGGGEERGERQQRPSRGDDGDGGPPAKEQAPKGDNAPPRKERPARADDDDKGPPKQRGRDGEDGPARKERPAKDEDGPRRQPAPAQGTEAPPERAAPPKPAPKAEPETPKAAPDAPKAEPSRKFEPDAKREPKDAAPKPAVPRRDGDEKTERPKAGERGDRRDGPRPDATTAPETKAPETKAPETKAPETKAPDGAARPAGRDTDTVAPPAGAPAAGTEVKDLKELKEERKERSEDGGKRVLIEEPDKRVIVKEGGKSIIRHDETERFRRLPGTNVRREKRNGLDISDTIRPGGIEIFTENDERGRPLRRYRRDRDGREVMFFDNRDYYRRHRDGSFIDAIIDLPPPRMSIPRESYIVDYEEASDVDVYEALSAPPVEELDRGYSLEEVRRSPMLRDRMRRIDLDSINFAFGSWEVASDQYPALERVAKAIKRVIERNADEMFLIEGHTDAVGSDEDNLSLSDRRAESVAIILTEEFGVPPENMTTQGYGEQYLKVETQDEERQNRRVAVRRITPLLSRSN
jgi:outer membrane protein OmpA-like peptidoglycan-associated protein